MTKQQLFLKVIQLDPDNGQAHYLLGRTLAPRGATPMNGRDPMTREQLLARAQELGYKPASSPKNQPREK